MRHVAALSFKNNLVGGNTADTLHCDLVFKTSESGKLGSKEKV